MSNTGKERVKTKKQKQKQQLQHITNEKMDMSTSNDRLEAQISISDKCLYDIHDASDNQVISMEINPIKMIDQLAVELNQDDQVTERDEPTNISMMLIDLHESNTAENQEFN